jgi:Flp pilus assembly protein TadD
MAVTVSNRQLVLSLSLIWLCFSMIACGSGKTAEESIKQGKEALNAKQYEQAIAKFSEAIKLNPESTQAFNNRGIAYCNKGDLDLAIADFSRVVELDPKFGKAYNNRAVAYFMKGERDLARLDVDKAQSLGIQVNPMLIGNLNPMEAKGAAPGQLPGPPPPGITPAPGKPEAKEKPEAKGKPDPKKAGEAPKK